LLKYFLWCLLHFGGGGIKTCPCLDVHIQKFVFCITSKLKMSHIMVYDLFLVTMWACTPGYFNTQTFKVALGGQRSVLVSCVNFWGHLCPMKLKKEYDERWNNLHYIVYYEIIFIHWTFNFMFFVGKPIHDLRSHQIFYSF